MGDPASQQIKEWTLIMERTLAGVLHTVFFPHDWIYCICLTTELFLIQKHEWKENWQEMAKAQKTLVLRLWPKQLRWKWKISQLFHLRKAAHFIVSGSPVVISRTVCEIYCRGSWGKSNTGHLIPQPGLMERLSNRLWGFLPTQGFPHYISWATLCLFL